MIVLLRRKRDFVRALADSLQKSEALESPEFIQRLKNGDALAFQDLFNAYYNRVYNLAMRLTRNPDEAEEILQETFLSVFDKIHTFQERSRLSTWIYAITSNGALSRLRKKSESYVTFGEDVPLNIDVSWFRNGSILFDIKTEDPVIKNELRDRQELLDYVLEEKGDAMSEDIKEQYQKIKDVNDQQIKQLELQRERALERLGF